MRLEVPPEPTGDDKPSYSPEALLRRIIASATSEGDLVFDPFCGSGTTLVAAQGMGRCWIGCDSSAIAVETATNRLRQLGSKQPFSLVAVTI